MASLYTKIIKHRTVKGNAKSEPTMMKPYTWDDDLSLCDSWNDCAETVISEEKSHKDTQDMKPNDIPLAYKLGGPDHGQSVLQSEFTHGYHLTEIQDTKTGYRAAIFIHRSLDGCPGIREYLRKAGFRFS